MNFKIIFFINLVLISACGVKKAPHSPPDRVVESYIEEFTKENPEQLLKKKTP